MERNCDATAHTRPRGARGDSEGMALGGIFGVAERGVRGNREFAVIRLTEKISKDSVISAATIHPKAISRIIIITNPSIVPEVATSVLRASCDSGINSSTTTKIIAPAAKARAYGRIGLINKTAAAPSIPAMGSINAEDCPYRKLLKGGMPSARRGTATATPSGKFWMPMPMASAIAPASVADERSAATAPKATPTASPSGKLWRVMAETSRTLRLHFV